MAEHPLAQSGDIVYIGKVAVFHALREELEVVVQLGERCQKGFGLCFLYLCNVEKFLWNINVVITFTPVLSS